MFRAPTSPPTYAWVVTCQKKCPPEPEQEEVVYLVSFDLNKNRKCPPEPEQDGNKKL
jgi:hypothetical protein